MNMYAYVGNDPYNNTDPTGNLACGGICIGAGLYVVFEAVSTAYDLYDAGTTLADPNASGLDKGIAVAGVGAGILLPGPGKVYKEGAEAGANFAGGAYKKLRGNGSNGIECHHCPANSGSPVSKGDGPAIQMEKGDHRQTASWGQFERGAGIPRQAS